MSRPDVAVVGLGPAGRALAHRLVARGASVVAVDPAPDAPWSATYGGWVHQLPAWLGAAAGAESPRVDLIAHGRHRLGGRYLVLDNAVLQRRLDLGGADVRAARVPDADLAGLASVVVDCRGARGVRRGTPGPLQTAHGVALPRQAAEPLLGGADAVLMDWRPDDGGARWGVRRPSFCYVVPLPDGRVLAEETCLAGLPPLPEAELAERLHWRLIRAGVDPAVLAAGEVEHVRIPMTPPRGGLPDRFGSAAGELNPITGYSVFASLAAADDAARTLLETERLRPRRDPWRPLALGALLQLRPDGVVGLFDAFGRLPARQQRVVLDAHAPAPALLAALARQWTLMPAAVRAGLVAATVRAGVRRRAAGERPGGVRKGDRP